MLVASLGSRTSNSNSGACDCKTQQLGQRAFNCMSDFLSHPNSYPVLGGTAGFVGGWLFYRLWRALLPRGHARKFWQGLPDELRAMLATDELHAMLKQYRAIMLGIARHTGRNLWAVIVGIAPLSLFCILFDVLVNKPSGLDRNPLAPHLDDFEFAVFVFAAVGSAAAAWQSRQA